MPGNKWLPDQRHMILKTRAQTLEQIVKDMSERQDRRACIHRPDLCGQRANLTAWICVPLQHKHIPPRRSQPRCGSQPGASGADDHERAAIGTRAAHRCHVSIVDLWHQTVQYNLQNNP